MKELFSNVDCVELYVDDLDEGLRCYRDCLELKLPWRANASADLGMTGDVTEVVLQTEHQTLNVDFKVDSVEETANAITAAGGKVTCAPFDIPIGKRAVVQDSWQNQYVVLDMSKGRYETDKAGNVIGVN